MEEMDAQGDNGHFTKRVTLPSGKTIEVVYFADEGFLPEPDAPGHHAGRGSSRTCTCASSATPSSSTPSSGRRPARRTGACCSTARTATCSARASSRQENVELFDEELDRGADALARDYKRLMRANMADEIDRFVGALDAGAILPEDF